MFIKRIFKIGLVAVMASALTATGQVPQPAPKPDKPKKHSGFGKLVKDDAKIKELREAFKAAAKKHWGGIDRDKWKDATDDEKKALREQVAASRKEWLETMKSHRQEVHARIKEIREEFKNKRDEVIDGNDPKP